MITCSFQEPNPNPDDYIELRTTRGIMYNLLNIKFLDGKDIIFQRAGSVAHLAHEFQLEILHNIPRRMLRCTNTHIGFSRHYVASFIELHPYPFPMVEKD